MAPWQRNNVKEALGDLVTIVHCVDIRRLRREPQEQACTKHAERLAGE